MAAKMVSLTAESMADETVSLMAGTWVARTADKTGTKRAGSSVCPRVGRRAGPRADGWAGNWAPPMADTMEKGTVEKSAGELVYKTVEK